MPENSVLPSQEAERAELEVVVEALARLPRLSRLVRYLGQKYFQGEIDQLHEYDIATEVFGRSKTTFEAGEDAIARVEVHRLRRRLKEYYETAGKDHPVQLVIPSGTYIPFFTHRADEPPDTGPHLQQEILPSAADLPAPSAAAPAEAPGTGQRTGLRLRIKHRGWLFALATAALLVAALGVYRYSRSAAIGKDAAATRTIAEPVTSSPAAISAASLPIRLIAGYKGRPQMDSAGAIWVADQYFHGGGTWLRAANFLARTSDPLLFEQWRTRDFFYDIPLKPGVYELHLYFVSSARTGDAPATFSMGINGIIVLQGFDVNSDALGEDVADERIFRGVSPSKDGVLHLSFTSERGAPALNALEVLPGVARKQLPIRLVTLPTPFTDHNGNVWHPDDYFMNGRLSTQRLQITGTADPDLYAAERYGHFTYAIPVDTRDQYTLVLHFAESYFGPQASGVGGPGSRLFRVICNGSTLLDNFDIYKEAGSLHALTKTFYHLKPSAQGKLNLTFEPIVNNATVSSIEVLDESE